MSLFVYRPGVRRAPWPSSAVATSATLIAAITAHCVALWPEWRRNPDLSHGFLTPLIFGLLVWESRRLGPLRWAKSGTAATVMVAGAAGASVALFALAGLFSASVGWSHALVLFLLAAALVSLLAAGLGVLGDERIRAIPLNWVSATALFLWLLAAPVPTGTYYRLTFALQHTVTEVVMTVLQFLGIPARQHGNVIELAHAVVGIEEACSGIRSLISCIFAGFFFAAWQVRRPLRRACLILVAPILAFVMNITRSLALTLMANGGVDIGGHWHDITGYAVLGLTSVVLAVLAMKLETAPPVRPEGTAPLPPAAGLGGRLAGVVGAACAILGLALFFVVNVWSHRATDTSSPDLTKIVPAAAAGWSVTTPDDLYQFSGVLETTSLLQRTYRRQGPSGPEDLTVYIAYWPPGQTSVSRVASHTPDACWPGSGWIAQDSVTQHRQAVALPGLTLAPSEYRLFRTDRGYEQHVWFWHVFDGRVIDYRDPYSLSALLQIAWQYGFDRQGSQYFIRISSNRPWSELAREPLLRELAQNLRAVGL